ncbi:HGGxSTG domain-containing protein [Polynucleobacter sp. AP-Capit-er-40B-B4]|uniref:HGGxSTG domain-containing protein n=1 Tax=Polynucleobacter sp. AP-Capit-er-40B-B4 TaxID=2576927 RepID=UPI00351CF529
MQCGAKTRSGGQCQKHGMLNGRCRLHGGLSPKGRDHWNFLHGKCTKERRARNIQTTQELRMLAWLVKELNML